MPGKKKIYFFEIFLVLEHKKIVIFVSLLYDVFFHLLFNKFPLFLHTFDTTWSLTNYIALAGWQNVRPSITISNKNFEFFKLKINTQNIKEKLEWRFLFLLEIVILFY